MAEPIGVRSPLSCSKLAGPSPMADPERTLQLNRWIEREAWDRALPLADALLAEDPASLKVAHARAVVLRGLRHPDEIAAWTHYVHLNHERAVQLGWLPVEDTLAEPLYERGTALACAGRVEEACADLQRSARIGRSWLTKAKRSRDWAAVRETAAFAQLLAELAVAKPRARKNGHLVRIQRLSGSGGDDLELVVGDARELVELLRDLFEPEDGLLKDVALDYVFAAQEIALTAVRDGRAAAVIALASVLEVLDQRTWRVLEKLPPEDLRRLEKEAIQPPGVRIRLRDTALEALLPAVTIGECVGAGEVLVLGKRRLVHGLHDHMNRERWPLSKWYER